MISVLGRGGNGISIAVGYHSRRRRGAGDEGGEEGVMMLLERLMGDCESPFQAYMELQRRLLQRWMARGGTEEAWCQRLAPAFHARYGWIIER